MRSSIAPGFGRLARRCVEATAGAVAIALVLAWVPPVRGQTPAPQTSPAENRSRNDPIQQLPRGADASLLGGPGRVVPVVPITANLPLQSDPRAVSTALEQANRLVAEGKHDDALKALDVALVAQPRDPQLRFLYGVILADRGRNADATGVFEQLAADFPELPEPHNNLAVMHAATGDLDKARSALEDAVRALPGYALAHENLGDLYLRLAARSYERASKLDVLAQTPRDKLAMARELIARIAPSSATARPRPPRPD